LHCNGMQWNTVPPTHATLRLLVDDDAMSANTKVDFPRSLFLFLSLFPSLPPTHTASSMVGDDGADGVARRNPDIR
jgi:hypothetical protein